MAPASSLFHAALSSAFVPHVANQIEHPVNEMISSIDLIEEHIRVAMCGNSGTNRENNSLPYGGPFVRMDSHVYTHYAVPPSYDSLLGKPLFPCESGVDQLVEIIKIFHKRMPLEVVDLVSISLKHNSIRESGCVVYVQLKALIHPFVDEVRDPATRLPNGCFLPPLEVFNFKPHGGYGVFQRCSTSGYL